MRKIAVALLSVVVGAGMSVTTVFAAPKGQNHDQAKPGVIVIQGTVQSVHNDQLIVKTANWLPENGLGPQDPSATFQVNVAHAVEETYSGNVVAQPQIQPQEVIVVVGRLAGKGDGKSSHGRDGMPPVPVINAMVVEQAVGGNVNTDGTVTLASWGAWHRKGH